MKGKITREELDQSLVTDLDTNSQLNTNISYILNRPTSEIGNLQRLGRKINYGENPNAINYNSEGIACMMQGGCKIDDVTVAYVLWDNLNLNLNKNKLVIMNINNGKIVNEKELNYGWCNSIAFNNNKIYIAERGRTNDNSSINNGIIHIIDYTNLNEINSLNLKLNINAISIHENELYILEEGQNFIHKYDLDGTSKNSKVILQTNIADLYNQNILVDSNFIYLLSSRPSNLLNVFDFSGNIVKSYNIPTHGGMYFIGEPQFIYPLSSGDMILGSSIVYFNECVNQFFKFNLKKNINVELPIINYAETIYVNSEVDNYNPTGFVGNEYTTINEMTNINLRNIIVNGNNKSYKYTHISDNQKYMRITNVVFSEGAFAQYGHVNFTDCTFEKSINSNDEAPLRIRDLNTVLQNCTFNANGQKYAINAVRNNIIKLVRPSFNEYDNDIIGNAGAGNVIDFNNYDNMPFINHSNIKKYNLFTNGFVRYYKPGEYSYNTNLSSKEIQKIMDNCYRIRIIYEPFNNSTKVIELVKNSTHSYTFVDTTVSTSSLLIRHCKTQLKLTINGYKIESNYTKSFNGTDWVENNANDGSSSDLFNTIRSIELIP